MSDELDIRLEVGFEEYDKVNGKLQTLINQLQKNGKLSLQVDGKLIQTQMKQIQENIKVNPIDLKITDNSLSNIKKIGQNFEQLKRQMQELYGNSGSVNLSASGLDDIKKFTVSVTKANGVIEKFKYALNKDTDTYELFNVESIDKTAEIYEKQLQKVQDINGKIADEEQKLADLIANGREKAEAARKKRIDVDNANQDKAINKNKEDEYKKRVEDEEKADNLIYKARKDLLTKLELLQNKYKDLADKDQVTNLKSKLDNLSNTDLNKVKKDLVDINNEYKRLVEDTRNKGVRNQDSRSLINNLKHDFVKFTEFYIVGGLVTGVKDAFIGTITHVKDMDDALVSLNKVVDLSKGQMEEMRVSALDLGRDLGKSSVDIMKGMAEFGRVTKDLNEIKELTKVSVLTSNVTDLSTENAAKSLNSTIINFKLNAKDAMGILDQWNEIQNNFRVSAEDLSASISKVGNAAAQSGTSIQQLEGYTAALVSSLGITGDEAGTALKSGISRIFRIGEEGFDDQGKAEKMLNSIGVAVRNSKGEFLGFDTIIQNTSKAFQSLTNTQQMAVAQAIGGTHHYSKYISLLNNMDIATRATETALNSQGSALQENEKYLNSVSGQYEVFKTNLEAVKQSTLESDDLKFILDIGNGMVSVIQKVGGFTTTLIALNAVILMTNKSYKEWIAGMTFEKAITSIKSFSASTKVAVAENGVLKGSVNSLSAAFTGLGISAKLTQAAMTMGLSIAISLLISGVVKLGEYLFNAKQRMKEMNEETSNFIKETGKNYGEVNTLIKEQEKLEESLKSGKLTTDEATLAQQQLADTQKRIAEILPSATTQLNNQSEALATNIDLTKELNEEQKKAMADKGVDYLNRNNITQDSVDIQIEKYQQARKEYQALQLALKQGKEELVIKEDVFSQVSGQWEIRDKVIDVKKELSKFGDDVKEKEVELRRLAEMVNAVNQAYGKNVFNIDMSEFNGSLDENTDKWKANTKAKEENANVQPERNYEQEYKDTADSLEKMTSNLEFYNKALKELDDGGISSDTFSKIISDYPQLLAYVGDEAGLREKINSLIGEESNAQQESYNKMLMLSEEYYNAKISGDTEMQNQLISLFNSYGGKLTDGYNADLRAYKNLEQAKGDMTTNLLKQLAGAWSNYWSSTANDFSDEMWYGLRYNPEETAKLEAIRDKIRAMQNGFNNITIPSINVGGIGSVGKVGSSGSSDKSSAKEIADMEAKLDLYYNIEDGIKKVNQALELNQTLQEKAQGKDKIKLMEEEIKLYERKMYSLNELYKAQKREQDQLESRLRNNGFEVENGEIKNLNDRLLAMQNWANSLGGDSKEQAITEVKALEEATKRYIELINNDLPNSNKEWYEVSNAIKDAQDELINSVKDMQEKMTEVVKSEVDKRKKAIDDEYNAKKDAVEKEKNLYNKQNAEDDYKSELAKEEQKLMEIQESIDRMSRDTTEQGKAKLQELMNEYKAQQEKIDEMIKNNQRDRINEQFEEEQRRLEEEAQKKKDELDKKYDDKTIAQIALQAIMNGFFEFEGEIINTQNALMKFMDETGESLLANGKLLQEEFINKLKEASEIIKTLGNMNISINMSTGNLPSYDVGTSYVKGDQIAKIHDGEMIIPKSFNPLVVGNKLTDILRQQILKSLPKMSIPNPISNPRGKYGIEFNQPFVVVQGNVTEDSVGLIESMVDRKITDFKKQLDEWSMA